MLGTLEAQFSFTDLLRRLNHIQRKTSTLPTLKWAISRFSYDSPSFNEANAGLKESVP